MNNLMVKEVNVTTGEEIIRPMTDEEIEQYRFDIETSKQKNVEEKTKAAARQAILDRLGITEEEARLLLG